MECICLESEHAGIPFEAQVVVPVTYKDTTIPLGFQVDFVVDACIILEVKAVALFVSKIDCGLLAHDWCPDRYYMKLDASRFDDGLRRVVA
jgi:GxxExxY protein